MEKRLETGDTGWFIVNDGNMVPVGAARRATCSLIELATFWTVDPSYQSGTKLQEYSTLTGSG